MAHTEASPYRSPISKLLRFFPQSRDQWKEKCKEAKREKKSLKTRLGKMKESRDRWKAEARSLRERLQAVAASTPTEGKKAVGRPAANRLDTDS